MNQVPTMSVHTNDNLAERDRLIVKGKSVFDLCIEQNKILCIQGFVDSQIERGGVYLDVVRTMRDYIADELTDDSDRKRRKLLRELHEYVAAKLRDVDANIEAEAIA